MNKATTKKAAAFTWDVTYTNPDGKTFSTSIEANTHIGACRKAARVFHVRYEAYETPGFTAFIQR